MADVRYGVVSEKADSEHSCDHVHDPSHELDHHHHHPHANDQDCQNGRDLSSVHDHDQDNQR